MPPKKKAPEPSKKADLKKKEKIIEVNMLKFDVEIFIHIYFFLHTIRISLKIINRFTR